MKEEYSAYKQELDRMDENIRNNKIDEEVKSAIDLYPQNISSNSIRKIQYEQNNNFLYLALLELNLSANRLQYGDYNDYEDKILNLLIKIPNNKEYSEISNIFAEYLSLIKQQIYSQNPNLELIKQGYDYFESEFSLINAKLTANIKNSEYNIDRHITTERIKSAISDLKSKNKELGRSINFNKFVNLKVSNEQESEIIANIRENLILN